MSAKTVTKRISYKEKNFTWVNIDSPNERMLQNLRKKYKFHHLDIEDCLSEIQRPKIDEYDNYLFIVLHVPVKTPRRRVIHNSEIDVFIGPNYVITVHKDNPIIENIFNQCKSSRKVREEYMSQGSGYLLYMIINEMFESRFPLMDSLSRQISEMEKDVFDTDYSKDRLRDILLIKKDIINFRNIMMPQRSIIAQLEHKNKKFLPDDLDVYFDDVVDKIEKIWNNLENLKELVASLQETNESIISHNTNNVIKILTIFSVIMLPLTFITGFYGMNVDNLPFAHNNASILIITGLLMGIVALMVAYFRYRKWL